MAEPNIKEQYPRGKGKGRGKKISLLVQKIYKEKTKRLWDSILIIIIPIKDMSSNNSKIHGWVIDHSSILYLEFNSN